MDEMAALFKALSDPTRLAIFNCVRRCEGGCGYDTEAGCCSGCDVCGVSVFAIRGQLCCAPSTVTHHLNELRDAGLITTEKRGRIVYCKLRPEALQRVAAFIAGA